MKTAAELVIQVLADAGVKRVFGISGDSVLALIDAIERTPGIDYMTVFNEQVGTSMADGYARGTGNPGVEIDQMGLLRPITKWGARIISADSAARVTKTALTMALSGRPGPVHIELPKDIAKVESSVGAGAALKFSAIQEASRVGPNPKLVEKACDLLLAADRPVILAGGGVLRSAAEQSLLAFAELLPIPVATTSNGRGTIP